MSLERELSTCSPNLAELSDDALAVAARDGDRKARNALYLRYMESMEAMITRAIHMLADVSRIDGSMEAEDVVQQTFLIFCNLLDKWHGDPLREEFASYLYRTLPSDASHFVRDTLHFRTLMRGGRVDLSDAISENEQSTLLQHDNVGHDSHYNHVESEIGWGQQMRDLCEPEKRLLTMYYSCGFSTTEIAALSGIAPRTVQRRLNAAIRNVRSRLLADWDHCA